MKREKLEEKRKIRERAEFHARAIYFTYERDVQDDGAVKECDFSINEIGETQESSICNGTVNLTVGKNMWEAVKFTMSRVPQVGDLMVLGETLKEIERIMHLSEGQNQPATGE